MRYFTRPYLLLGWLVIWSLLAMPGSVAQAKNGAEGSEAPSVRVGIWSNQPNLLVSTDADFNIINADTDERLGRYGAKTKVSIASRDGSIFLNGVKMAATRLLIVADDDTHTHFIEVNRHSYRGQIEIHRTHNKTGLTVVNTLPVEQYLYGVIPKEISPEWNMEVLKAQAVAARTYVMANLNKFGVDGYDVCAGTECQVYGGYDSEAARASTAVDETAGIVLTYQGNLIEAAFHSSSGGYTENSENVWGSYTPYLRAVNDDDQKSPNFRWRKEFTAVDVNNALQKGGVQIGKIQAFDLSLFTGQPASQDDRGVSGRVKKLRLIGSAGSVEVSGMKLRSLLNLPSTLFDIQIMVPSPQKLDFTITNDYGASATKEVPAHLPMFPQRKNPGDSERIRRLLNDPNELIVINGYGYGHGLGLSQWGAKIMADQAPANEKNYFRQILKHYYQGVELTKLY